MTTTEDRNSELLAIADQAERNYGILSFEAADMVRSIAETAGEDWPARWDVAIRAVQNCEPGAMDSFVRLANAFEVGEVAYGAASDTLRSVEEPAEDFAPDVPGDDEGLRSDDGVTVSRDLPGIRTRSLEIRAKSIDIEARTVRATLVTEEPVPVWDAVRYEMVPEILRADGAILPTQVPLLDSHNRASMSDQLGSVRDIVQDGDAIAGTLRFADTDEANHVFGLARDGHTDSVSAGYSVLTQVYVAAGRSSVVRGRTYEGPVNVVTKWKLREVSFAPIVLDETAKLRAAAL